MAWQLQEAKQRFSEVVRRALDEGPQVVTRRGEEAVVIVSAEEYHRLAGAKPDLRDFILNGPDLGDLDLDEIREESRRWPERQIDFDL